ncbi:hypothetical protein [Luteolibacter sp. AS25]|uniref:hypothetical protein n=1 Tax=Luteolibacter sp. AS25 TaxID=3135776 RepID=UPI00398AD791
MLALLCWYRTLKRLREADQPIVPEPPALDGQDLSVLIRYVVHDFACGSHRVAGEMGLQNHIVARSLDKLESWDFVERTKDYTAAGAEYRVTPSGRARAMEPAKHE